MEAIVNQDQPSRGRYRMAAYTTVASVVSKAISLLVLYSSVPLTISYLGARRFGVWMTLASFISFLGFLDFGIGSSLVNEVAHLNVGQPRLRLKRLITHALLVLSGIGVVLVAIGLLAAINFDFSRLFNVSGRMESAEFRDAALTLCVLIGISLPIVGLQRVFWGLQRAFIYHLLAGCGSLFSLGLLYWLAHRHAGIAWLLFATFGVQLLATIPLLGILAARDLVGSFDLVEFRQDSRNLLRHGALFFVLSIGGAIAWDSDYIIISSASGPVAVATYAVGVRLFQLVEVPLQMVNTPLWSAYADAMAHNSRVFLRKTLKRAFFGTLGVAVVACGFLFLFRGLVVHFWVHEAVVLPVMLTAAMALWTVLRAGGNSFAMYLNGIRVVGPQVTVVIAFCILALPLKIYAAYRAGALGVVLASMASYILCVVVPYLTIFRSKWRSPILLKRGERPSW
jgi:O-antigen/teichoic acid export membrane protein